MERPQRENRTPKRYESELPSAKRSKTSKSGSESQSCLTRFNDPVWHTPSESEHKTKKLKTEHQLENSPPVSPLSKALMALRTPAEVTSYRREKTPEANFDKSEGADIPTKAFTLLSHPVHQQLNGESQLGIDGRHGAPGSVRQDRWRVPPSIGSDAVASERRSILNEDPFIEHDDSTRTFGQALNNLHNAFHSLLSPSRTQVNADQAKLDTQHGRGRQPKSTLPPKLPAFEPTEISVDYKFKAFQKDVQVDGREDINIDDKDRYLTGMNFGTPTCADYLDLRVGITHIPDNTLVPNHMLNRTQTNHPYITFLWETIISGQPSPEHRAKVVGLANDFKNVYDQFQSFIEATGCGSLFRNTRKYDDIVEEFRLSSRAFNSDELKWGLELLGELAHLEFEVFSYGQQSGCFDTSHFILSDNEEVFRQRCSWNWNERQGVLKAQVVTSEGLGPLDELTLILGMSSEATNGGITFNEPAGEQLEKIEGLEPLFGDQVMGTDATSGLRTLNEPEGGQLSYNEGLELINKMKD